MTKYTDRYDDQVLAEVMSTMQFSTYSLAKYIEALEQKGFVVVEVLEKPCMRDSEPEVHYFCELKRL